MKNKNTFNYITKVLIFSISVFSVASLVSAHNGIDDGDGDINAVRVNVRDPSMPIVPISVKVKADAGASVKAEMVDDTEDEGDGGVYKTSSSSASAEVKAENGKKIAEEHRSVVANLVLKLNAAADRDGGIGPEVRAVAKEQASTSEKIAVNVEKIQKRNKFWVFLFGSDYKAMGELRSDLKVTENSISQLTAALNKTTNASVKADLQSQINVLSAEDAKIDTFLDAHAESKGLLGWLK